MLKDLKILYAEDEDFIRENVIEILQIMSMDVTAATNGEEAYELYKKIKPNVVITDIEMPKLNGLELAQKIRKTDKETQIIVTTAYTNTEYFLKAVELNLSKYILKPITLVDLNSALKNCENNLKPTNSIYFFNKNDNYDSKNNKLIVNNNTQKLDYKENRLLELLVKNANKTVSYNEIESYVWENDFMTSLAIRALVGNLRKKLPKDVIENISKTGYLIKVKNA